MKITPQALQHYAISLLLPAGIIMVLTAILNALLGISDWQSPNRLALGVIIAILFYLLVWFFTKKSKDFFLKRSDLNYKKVYFYSSILVLITLLLVLYKVITTEQTLFNTLYQIVRTTIPAVVFWFFGRN